MSAPTPEALADHFIDRARRLVQEWIEEHQETGLAGAVDEEEEVSLIMKIAKDAAEREREIERLKLLVFAPMGDNHHNAAACPYCTAQAPR